MTRFSRYYSVMNMKIRKDSEEDDDNLHSEMKIKEDDEFRREERKMGKLRVA